MKNTDQNRFWTGEPCQRGHLSERYVSNRNCVECSRLRVQAHRERHPEREKAYRRKGYLKAKAHDPEIWNKSNAAWRAKNPEKAREKCREFKAKMGLERRASYNRDWRARNPEKAAEHSADWRGRNATWCRARKARQAATMRCQTPPWADLKSIEQIYRRSRRITRETGIEHNVDHIVPLQGRNVCGLHVPWNLRVIPAAVNRKKQNYLLEDAELADGAWLKEPAPLADLETLNPGPHGWP